jgi:[acyl-carrier-protein] S-malonyltransferase
MESAAAGLREELDRVRSRDAAIPVVANQSARPVTAAAEIRVSLERQLLSAVRWEECMHRLIREVGSVFVEIGPGRVLKGLARSIDRTARVDSVEDPAGARALMESVEEME